MADLAVIHGLFVLITGLILLLIKSKIRQSVRVIHISLGVLTSIYGLLTTSSPHNSPFKTSKCRRVGYSQSVFIIQLTPNQFVLFLRFKWLESLSIRQITYNPLPTIKLFQQSVIVIRLFSSSLSQRTSLYLSRSSSWQKSCVAV